ncbi:MAG TPA: translocation/assembly module TamB domain-containing protein [Bryobacteraceae bacterium]|nr:translocation/assembly module TamB domain-containing protein [Bryobacteraceae bacterium]
MRRFWRRLRHISLRAAVAVVIVLAAAALSLVMVVRSGWFQERVRERIIAALEDATGGRVEIGGFHFDWEHLTATVAPLVLHGTERAGEPPLASVRSITVRLRIISMLERRVDLASLRLDQPLVRIAFYPDGSTNFPTPRIRKPRLWSEDLVNLAVRRYEVVDGVFEDDDRQIPVNLRGEDLRVVMNYDAHGAKYQGQLASRRFRIVPGRIPPIEVDASADFVLYKSRLEIPSLRVATRKSRADLTGTLSNLRSPRGTFALKAAIDAGEAAGLFDLPIARTGAAAFDGQLSVAFQVPFEFTASGFVNAHALAYSYERLKIEGVDVRAGVRMNLDSLKLDSIVLTAPEFAARGDAVFAPWRHFHFDGSIEGLGIRRAAEVITDRPVPWSGTIAGGFSVNAEVGQPAGNLSASLTITPGGGGEPLGGAVQFSYDQASDQLQLESAHVATPATELDVAGIVGNELSLRARSTNLDDVIPALAVMGMAAPKELPVKLVNGNAGVNGTVSGPLNDPQFSGEASLTNASVGGHFIERTVAQVQANRRSVQLRGWTASRGATQLDGSAAIAAANGDFSNGTVDANLNLRNAQLADVAKETGANLSISGVATARMHLFGAIRQPQAEVAVEIEQPAGFGERLDRLHANLQYSAELIRVTGGQADAASGKILFEGAYQHRANDWNTGELQYNVAAQNIAIAQIEHVAKLQPGLEGRLDAKMNGGAGVAKGGINLRSVNGEASLHKLVWDGQAPADIALTAETRGADLTVHSSAKVRDLSIEADGQWKLEGDDPGSATVRLARASLASVNSVVLAGGPLEKSVPPFEGFIDGAGAAVSVALRKPQDFRAEVTIPTVQLNPKANQTLRVGVELQDVVLTNMQPVVIAVSADEARIRSAQFSARDTRIEVSGGVPFHGNTGADLNVRGSVNLIILQLLNPDLAARGNATVQAAIRGSLKDPRVNGRLVLNNASLYLGDLPNGVDNANGAFLFDRNRATIERLTAETGGGTVRFTGFIGFGSTLVYRLQAVAEKVRVRYPEDVSVTFNATLALNGTSDSSTVSGLLTVNRASFTARADLAQIFAAAARPIPAPSGPSGYIRGMQFDVRVESGPNFGLETSLTRNLQGSIDLRLRGTPLRPALVGSVSINEGEVQIFGNRYTVDRCDVRFINPVKIDPIVDMDLETRARGVTVNVAISGTTQKLNVNYSSDPPMQPRDIIALLAVGRTPTETGSLSAEQSSSSSTSLEEAGGGLLGQAITAQLSSRFQRFFGASRVRIDPTLTGVDYGTQARLTVEQQVSTAVTLTYITNLNRTEEQIVQIQWDFSPRWSAIAVRDANGLFGIDVQYRKRFK